MDNKSPRMLTAEDIMDRLSVSKSTAYQIMRDINKDLEKQGLKIRPGRVSQKHFDAIYFGENGGE